MELEIKNITNTDKPVAYLGQLTDPDNEGRLGTNLGQKR
jgi:hypothetical protein